MKERIVIDTNVLVSALIRDGYPSKILKDLIFERKVWLCLSKDVWQEYIDVLNRDKFSRWPEFKENARILLSKIEDLSEIYSPDVKYSVIKDVDDNKFLELAVFSKSKYLVTGNTKDFTFKKFKKVRIINPRDYWIKHFE